jgi:hypothetical protein
VDGAKVENKQTRFPLSHRPGYGCGGMFAWKNHGRCIGRIDGWWNDLRKKITAAGDSA